MSPGLESAKTQLLSEGLYDMLDLSWIIGVVARCSSISVQDEDRLIEPTLDVIKPLLDERLVIAGPVVKGPDGLLEVNSWGLSPGETVERIRREWLALGRSPNAGDVVWLELTEKGRAYARSREDE